MGSSGSGHAKSKSAHSGEVDGYLCAAYAGAVPGSSAVCPRRSLCAPGCPHVRQAARAAAALGHPVRGGSLCRGVAGGLAARHRRRLVSQARGVLLCVREHAEVGVQDGTLQDHKQTHSGYSAVGHDAHDNTVHRHRHTAHNTPAGRSAHLGIVVHETVAVVAPACIRRTGESVATQPGSDRPAAAHQCSFAMHAPPPCPRVAPCLRCPACACNPARPHQKNGECGAALSSYVTFLATRAPHT